MGAGQALSPEPPPAASVAGSGVAESPVVLASFCRRFCSCFCSCFFFLASSRWRFSNE